MKRQRHTPEQIIRKLRAAEQMLSEGKTPGEAAKALEVSEQTLHRWRNQYGGMKAGDVKRLKELEKENRELKQIVADQTLDIRAYKEIAKGNSGARRRSLTPCASSGAKPIGGHDPLIGLWRAKTGRRPAPCTTGSAAGERPSMSR